MILQVMEATLSLWVNHGVVKLKEYWVVTMNLHQHWQRKDAALLVQQVLLSTAESQPWQLTT